MKETKQTLSSFSRLYNTLSDRISTNQLKSICIQNTLVNFINLANSLSQYRKMFEEFSSTLGRIDLGCPRKTSEIFFPFSRWKVMVKIGSSKSIWGNEGRFDGEKV